jgi:hypothetical protein
LCGFNICSRTNRAHPGSNSLDYDLDARQCAFDFTLHPLNSDLRNVCSCRSSDESPLSPPIEFEVERTSEDMILSASTSIWVSGFGSFSPLNESDFLAGAAEHKGGETHRVFFETDLTSTRA